MDKQNATQIKGAAWAWDWEGAPAAIYGAAAWPEGGPQHTSELLFL